VAGTPGTWTVLRVDADGGETLLGMSECAGARRAAVELAQQHTSRDADDVQERDVDERDWAPTGDPQQRARRGGRHTRGRRAIAAQHRDAGMHIARALAAR
jgi:hypothetical protein